MNTISDMEPKRPVSVVRILWTALAGNRWLFVVAIVAGILDSAFQVSLPLAFRYVLNELQTSPDFFERFGFAHYALLGGWLALFLPIALTFHWCMMTAIGRCTSRLKMMTYKHVERLSPDYTSTKGSGAVLQSVHGDVDQVYIVGEALMVVLWACCTITLSTAAVLFINVWAGLAAIVFQAALFLGNLAYLPRVYRASREVQENLAESLRTTSELLRANLLIQAFSLDKIVERRLAGAHDELQKARERTDWKRYKLGDVTQTITRVMVPMVILLVSAYLISIGELLFGDLVAFWALWMIVGMVIPVLSASVGQSISAYAALRRALRIFDEEPPVVESATPKVLESTQGHLTLDSVTYYYPDSGLPALENVSLDIEPGARVAIAGPSGSGKSTLLKLLLRFADPTSGTIYVDGVDLKDSSIESLRAEIGFVAQQPTFFSASIEENLRIVRPDASRSEIRNALVASNAASFVDALPDGMATNIGEQGARLSGGQRQMLAIARVFLRDPRILLLDEATSALDSISERAVRQSIAAVMEGRTTIMVAHRFMSIGAVDRIIVLDGGVVAAEGVHDELFETNELYSTLYRNQIEDLER